MGWKVELAPEAYSALKKLGTAEAERVIKFLFNRIQSRDNPRAIGEALKGNLREYWRYRVGDYRILCRLEDEKVTVFVIQNSLGYFEKLKGAGFSEEQARVQVQAMQGVVQAYDAATRKNLATKGDIQDTRMEIQDVRTEIANTKHEILKWMVTGMLAQAALIIGVMAYIK